METLFIICAIVGGTLLVCQFLLSLIGIGHHDMDPGHDVGGGDADGHDGADEHHHGGVHDHGTAWYVGVLSFRALTAAVTFFGLGGIASSGEGRSSFISLAVAISTGLAALFLVAFIMRSLHKLKAEGTIRFDRAVGATGTVYLTIPAKKGGTGKVTLVMQNRTIECQAITDGEELATGRKVVVVGVIGPGTVEVAGDGKA
jgi:hypothetical protein